METECTAGTLPFQAVARRTVQARFDGGALTSDGGAVLLREVDRATGILAQFAACFRDAREPARITHLVEALQQSERLHAVMGLEDRVAFGFELRAEQLQVGGMVVNDEEVPGAFRSPANVVSADSTTVALIGRIQHLPNLSE